MNDTDLLISYVHEKSEDAFAEIVRRHLNLVYSAALRQLHGDSHLAQDVTQLVFSELARKAGKVYRHPALAGWLYTTTRRIAGHIIRSDQLWNRDNKAHSDRSLR